MPLLQIGWSTPARVHMSEYAGSVKACACGEGKARI